MEKRKQKLLKQDPSLDPKNTVRAKEIVYKTGSNKIKKANAFSV